MSTKYDNVTVQLTGRDGNAFAVIGAVAGALKDEVSREAADEFTAAAFNCESYDALLYLAQTTVHVR